jgi:hypothetical protein
MDQDQFLAEDIEEARNLSVDEAASELCGLLGCSAAEMKAALRLADGEPEKALSLLHSVLPSALALKGSFEGRRSSDPAGAFCLIAEGSSGKQLALILWAGYQRLPAAFLVDADWEAVKLALEDIATPPHKELCRTMNKLLEERLDPTSLNRLFRGQESLSSLTERLKEAISNQLRVDTFLHLHLETFNRLRLEQSGLIGSGDQNAEPDEKDDEKQRNAATLDSLKIRCRPLLDPVKGKPLSRVRKGERLHVSFEDQAGLSGLVAKMIARSGRDLVFPVSSVSKSPVGDYLIELDLADGVVGLVKHAEDLRVRTAPSIAADTKRPLSGQGLLFLYLGAGVLLLLLLLQWLLR